MKNYSFKRPFCYYLHPQISDLMPSLSRDTSTMTGIQGQIQWTRELLIHKFKTMGYYCSHYLSFRQKTQQISLDTSVPFIPIESVGIAKPLGWLESLWSSATAVRDVSQQSLYERKHHHCTVHDLLDFQIFRSSVNSVKGYKIFGYKYTFHSYGICWTSKTAWLAGVFMVVGDGGKRRQSIVSL